MTKKPTKNTKKPKITDQDQKDFQQAMDDIDRIPDHGRHTKPTNTFRMKRKNQSNHNFEDRTPINIYYSRDAGSLGPDDRLNYEQPHILKKDIKRLKKGDFSIEARLDLHLYTVEQAIDALHDFIDQCQAENIRFALVIHGKGHYSADGVPAIKNMLNQWLRNHPNVLAFQSAKPKDGGTGAIYILLKCGGK
ncbi:MAG: Smr/MutS family protein [Coxiellaceae bacterium]|nr:Smr/MutS family protein [Coxiellaceae bacterium]